MGQPAAFASAERHAMSLCEGAAKADLADDAGIEAIVW
jgi:hypothetical protein